MEYASKWIKSAPVGFLAIEKGLLCINKLADLIFLFFSAFILYHMYRNSTTKNHRLRDWKCGGGYIYKYIPLVFFIQQSFRYIFSFKFLYFSYLSTPNTLQLWDLIDTIQKGIYIFRYIYTHTHTERSLSLFIHLIHSFIQTHLRQRYVVSSVIGLFAINLSRKIR